MASSEYAPFAKTGGLADVVAALTEQLHKTGHDVRTFIPLYPRIWEAGLDLRPVDFIQEVPIQLGPWTYAFSIFVADVGETKTPVYFVDCPQLYGRENIYTADEDEHLRFLLLTRAALESCQRMGFSPHIAHSHDWQSSFMPLFIKSVYEWDQLFKPTKSVLTIHNIGYQGSFSSEAVHDLSLGGREHLLHQEDLNGGVINALKTGVMYADAITTVSETYAREIQTEEFGMGLEGFLQERRQRLIGIVNGVDYQAWSPETDKLIPHAYSPKKMAGKKKNKKALLEGLGLPFDAKAPTLGIVSRLTFQKGFELLFDVLPALLKKYDLRFVVLGSGEQKYVDFFQSLQRNFPSKVCFYHGYSNELAHLIEAGSDLFLMPSRFEPCGLNQMYSLRYGTIPVVRKTGGLADTVTQFNPKTGEGTGVVFDHFTAEGMNWALKFALTLFDTPNQWKQVQKNAMAVDFSWDRQVKQYET
ncbi:MAG: glycogen synthase GlgA, partial [Candidatus Eisenbacteria bacterium]|nr:glycogen synthase GlgA [Candidatus Eisenbacteria bacterium]